MINHKYHNNKSRPDRKRSSKLGDLFRLTNTDFFFNTDIVNAINLDFYFCPS